MLNKKCNCKSKHCGTDSVCNHAICGTPELLSVYAPVIYDEIGINVCRPVTVPAGVLADFPTATCAQLDVISIEFTDPIGGVPATTITSSRANCSTVVLTNVSVTYRVKLFDEDNNFLTSTIVTANYLPGSTDSTDYNYVDPETNPESVTLELYTPYGVGTTDATTESPYINVVGLLEGSNTVVNGINVTAVAKAMNFNPTTGVFSAGISIILRTVYYEAYKFEFVGKTVPPKADLNGEQGNTCLEFVESGLLSREIKPLELEPPKCESRLKDADDLCETCGCTVSVVSSCYCTDETDDKQDVD